MFENYSFFNGEYARWIKNFQRKNPETISFSNNLKALNKLDIEIVNLDPIAIQAKDIDPEDFENLGLLDQFFDFLQTYYGACGQSAIISVAGTLYQLTKMTDGERTYINVVDIKDDPTDLPIALTV